MNKKENIYSLKGFKQVFSFTARQTFKNKGYLVSFIIFVLVMTFMGPIQYAGQKAGRGAAEEGADFDPHSAVSEKMYIINNTAVKMSIDDFVNLYKTSKDSDSSEENSKGLTRESITVYNAGEVSSEDEIISKLGKKDGAVLISQEETGIKISGVISKDSEIEVSEIDSISEVVKDTYDNKRMKDSNISKSDIEMISSGVNTGGVVSEEDYLEEASKTIAGNTYFMYVLGFSMIVFIVVSMSTSYIITSVTEEKQSKLVESLLVSVRPMALLMGKVIGMMTYVVLVLACGMIGSNISKYVMKNVMHISESEFSTSGFDFSIFTKFGASGAFILLLSIILGFIAFGTIAGLFGSACTKTEDMQNATGSVMTISMLGYFASMAIAMMDESKFNMLASLIPPFSFFTAPVIYVTGRIELPILILSYVIQIVLIILIMRLSARTYRNLLLSDSSTPKLMAIIKSSKG